MEVLSPFDFLWFWGLICSLFFTTPLLDFWRTLFGGWYPILAGATSSICGSRLLLVGSGVCHSSVTDAERGSPWRQTPLPTPSLDLKYNNHIFIIIHHYTLVCGILQNLDSGLDSWRPLPVPETKKWDNQCVFCNSWMITVTVTLYVHCRLPSMTGVQICTCATVATTHWVAHEQVQ